MFLDNLRQPKWRHPKAGVRSQAAAELLPHDAAHQRILRELAQDDADPAVRRIALKRLSDLVLLRRCLESERDSQAREAAGVRYRQILAGGGDGAGLELRLAEIEACKDASVLAHVARRAREVELRLAALQRLNKQRVYEDAACNDAAARVRHFALAQLNDETALQRIMAVTRDSDEGVCAAARKRLNELAALRARRERDLAEREDVLKQLDKLAAAEGERVSEPLAQLQRCWAAIATPADPELAARFDTLVALCSERIRTARRETARAGRGDTPERLAEDLERLIASREPRAAALNAFAKRLRLACTGAQRRTDLVPVMTRFRTYWAVVGRYLAHARDLERELARAKAVDAGPQCVRIASERVQTLSDQISWDPAFPVPGLLIRCRYLVARQVAAGGQSAQDEPAQGQQQARAQDKGVLPQPS